MRDPRLYPLFAGLESLPGVGPKTAPVLSKLVGGERVLDLLLHLPERWLVRREVARISDVREGELVVVSAVVEAHEPSRRENQPYRVRMVDDTGFLSLVFFRANSGWLKAQLPVGARRLVAGKVEDWNGARQIVHPDPILDPASDAPPPGVEPIYRLSAGLSNRKVHQVALAALARVPDDLEEWGDGALLVREGWPGFAGALRNLHAPVRYDEAELERARARLAFDEAFARELVFQRARAQRESRRAPVLKGDTARRDALRARLPWPPTGAQMRAVAEIGADMARPHPMRRMLQGDVGSGKTLVAAFVALQAADAGHQVAVMAPTEVLARQQYATLRGLLEPMGVAVAALTGRDKGAVREGVLLGLADGSVRVVVGTHALFQETVNFARLGLVIVDEQHRFGVNDRARLLDKGEDARGTVPHTLVMSATPIPRTLALAIHGDVDMSILDEKPPGRSPVRTAAKPDTAIEEVIAAVGRALERGEQAFWICPRVDAEEEGEASAVHRQAALRLALGRDVALVHGRLKPEEKDAALERFRSGAVKVLVATTVVEVGVDVPDATIMVIERAETFGLAQLHQLRGRVGRGAKASACLLLYRAPLSESGQKRLQVLRETEDGFAIAEADFLLRGPGDVLGLRQSGVPEFRVIRLPDDSALMGWARDAARLASARGALDGLAYGLVVALLAPQV
jgi:ATP-dependent DNA helicase RecG